MIKINIRKPSESQLHTLKIYLNKAINEVENLESRDGNQESEDEIIDLFAWLTTISSFQNKLFIKDDKD